MARGFMLSVFCVLPSSYCLLLFNLRNLCNLWIGSRQADVLHYCVKARIGVKHIEARVHGSDAV